MQLLVLCMHPRDFQITTPLVILVITIISLYYRSFYRFTKYYLLFIRILQPCRKRSITKLKAPSNNILVKLLSFVVHIYLTMKSCIRLNTKLKVLCNNIFFKLLSFVIHKLLTVKCCKRLNINVKVLSNNILFKLLSLVIHILLTMESCKRSNTKLRVLSNNMLVKLLSVINHLLIIHVIKNITKIFEYLVRDVFCI